MNENRLKVNIGNIKKTKERLGFDAQSFFVKPSSKFWKRYFEKKVRKGAEYKKSNFWYWS